MSLRGLHIALTDDELSDLQALSSDEVAEFISNELEEKKFGTVDAFETDKSWGYIHSALNGTDPDGDLGPASQANGVIMLHSSKPILLPDVGAAKFLIIGTEQLLVSKDYFVGLIQAANVKSVESSLRSITGGYFRERLQIVHEHFKASGNTHEVCEYALGWLPGLTKFFSAAAKSGKNVIFTVDF